MNLPLLASRNVMRNRFRAVLTILGVAVAILAFILLRTILEGWESAAAYASQDRLATRNKVALVLPLPLRYVEEIRAMPGVQAVTWTSIFGGKPPKHERVSFSSYGVDGKTVLAVFDDVAIPEDQRKAWMDDRQGMIVGDLLAQKTGWKIGELVTLTSPLYPGNWQFRVQGIYTAQRKTTPRTRLFFHWDYLNASLPEHRREHVGMIFTRISDPSRSAEISAAIDQLFAQKDVQTVTMSEHNLTMSAISMVSAVLDALNLMSLVILAITALLLGNTIAMGVRERTHEYGALQAIGFLPHHIAGFIVGEALFTGAMGGLLGLGLSYPLVERGLGRFLEENVGQFFPHFRIGTSTAVTAIAASMVLGGLAALLPAIRASRMQVIDALRRID